MVNDEAVVMRLKPCIRWRILGWRIRGNAASATSGFCQAGEAVIGAVWYIRVLRMSSHRDFVEGRNFASDRWWYRIFLLSYQNDITCYLR